MHLDTCRCKNKGLHSLTSYMCHNTCALGTGQYKFAFKVKKTKIRTASQILSGTFKANRWRVHYMHDISGMPAATWLFSIRGEMTSVIVNALRQIVAKQWPLQTRRPGWYGNLLNHIERCNSTRKKTQHVYLSADKTSVLLLIRKKNQTQTGGFPSLEMMSDALI